MGSENILGPEKFWAKQKFLGPKIFLVGTQILILNSYIQKDVVKNLGPKKLRSQTISSPQNHSLKKFLIQKNVGQKKSGPKNFGSKNIWIQKMFGPKRVGVQKLSPAPKKLGLKMLITRLRSKVFSLERPLKNILSPKKVGP